MSDDLNNLQLTDDALPTAGDDLTKVPSGGGYTPPPQPGSYRFRLPLHLSPGSFEVFQAGWLATPGPRVALVLDDENPLLITSSKGEKHNGEPFSTRLTNAEMERGKKGSGTLASDLDYLLKAFGATEKPKSNKGYADAVTLQAGKTFGAELTYSWHCNPARTIRVLDEAGKRVEVPGKMGCGTRYKQAEKTNDASKKIPAGSDGLYPLEITCRCGAVVRAFANLENIRS